MTAASRNEPCRITPISCGMPIVDSGWVARSMVAHTERRGGDADGVVAAEQCDGDAGEPERLRELVAVVELRRSAAAPRPIMPAMAPEMMIVMRIMRFGLTPAVRAAAGLAPDDPQVEAEAAAVEQQPVADADAGWRTAGSRAATTPSGKWKPIAANSRSRSGRWADLRQRLGGRQVAAEVVAQRLGQQERADADGDVVEHDRRDHLVDAAPDLEDAGDRGVGGADDDGDDEHEGDVQRRRQRRPRRRRRRRAGRRAGTGRRRRC